MFTSTRSASRRPLAMLSASVLALAGLAGCGSDSGAGAGADPAAVVPAATTAYLSVQTRPSGDVKPQAARASKALLGSERPGQAIVDLLATQARTLRGLSFDTDVDPWLGDRAALALVPVGEGKSEPLLIAGSRDDDKARSALSKSGYLSADGSFREVSYKRRPDGSVAGAVFDGAVVLGQEDALKLAITASKDKTALSGAQRYAKAIGELPQGGIATVFADADALFAALGRLAGGDSIGSLLGSVLSGQADAIAATLIPEEDQLKLAAVGTGTGMGFAQLQAAGGASDAITKLPGDSWLAFGVSDVGGTLELLLRGLAAEGGIQAIGINVLLGQIESETGLKIREDILGWMGHGGLFIRGASRGEVAGAVVVESKDPAAMRRAVRRLRDVLPKLTLPGVPTVGPLSATGIDEGMVLTLGDTRLEIAAADDQLVIAVGKGALAAALRPGSQLKDSPEFKAAAARLGEGLRPGFYVDFAKLADLVESADDSGRGGQALAGILRGLTQATGGGKQDRDVSRVTIVSGLADR